MEVTQAVYHDVQCHHCGYRHFKASGRIRYYLGAMQCWVFVQMLLDDAQDWGMKVPARADTRAETGKSTCCAGWNGHVCVWKQPDSDVRTGIRCGSPDGFDSNTRAQDKVLYDNATESWQRNERLLCEYRKRHRERIEASGRGAKSHGSHSYKSTQFNEMPGTGDWRKQRVYSELERRIAYLKSSGIEPTAKNIAKLGGFTQRSA